MPIYRTYKAADGSEASTFQADKVDLKPEVERLLTNTVDGVPMVLEATFYAPNWRSAVEASNAILGYNE